MGASLLDERQAPSSYHDSTMSGDTSAADETGSYRDVTNEILKQRYPTREWQSRFYEAVSGP